MTDSIERDGVISPSAGRGLGICIGALFGMGWLYYAITFDHAPSWALYAAYAVTAALVIAGIMHIRSERKSGAKQSNAVRIAFLIVLAIEVGAIVASVILLQRFHLMQYVVHAIAAIVGLHFLPLAKIFRRPTYYATGLAIVAATAASVVLLKGEQQWICIGYSAGAILWLTAFIGAAQR
ncbi:MAG: hypothetical protein WAW96_00635 [Alphaproteobacteria bacterium]